MGKTTLMQELSSFNKKHAINWNRLILFTLSIAFTVTDWIIGIFTLSDFLLGFLAIFLVISGNYKINKKQLIKILFLLGIIIVNILVNDFNNDAFVLKTGIAAFIKTTYYSLVIAGFFNYIKNKRLEKQLLNTINIVALIVCVVGIYITIAIYSKGVLPYEFFWKLTRTDLLSYAFDSNEQLIRTRSIFSEPAYLGYYLNIILSVNYFNKGKLKISAVVNFILTLTILLTFSYSAIGIMVLMQLLYFFEMFKKKKLNKNKFSLIFIAGFLLVIFLSWDIIDATIIKRTIDILNGKDNSAIFRVVRSWDYINKDHLFMGNGIGHTPHIWNVYAYILSDLGLIAFVLFCLLSIYLLFINFKMGLLFIALNFQKGGYLSAAFWILILLLFIYIGDMKKPQWMKRKSLFKIL